MRYNEDREMLVASPAEVAGAAAALELSRGPLSTTLFEIGGRDEILQFEDGLLRLDAGQRAVFETALPIVADPVRSAMLRFYWSGLYVERFIAWSAAGQMAVMEQIGDEIGLRSAVPGDIKAEILTVLSSDVPFSGADTRFVMEGQDLFVTIAVADALRREWLESLLAHQPARGSVSLADVVIAMQTTMSGDPRWTSCALGRALPPEFLQGVGVEESLGRMVEMGVLAEADGDRFVPTVEAESALTGLAGASSTAVFTVYGAGGSGFGYETTLFVRDVSTVWTALISPFESFVASASPSALSALIDGALAVVG